jgi:hypothetical protein
VAVSREAYVAVVQNGDAPTDQETELVTIEFVDGEPSTIETTGGQRITLLHPAEDTDDQPHQAAA